LGTKGQLKDVFVLYELFVTFVIFSIFQQLGESKIASMVESKDFRKGIIQLEW